ncbi:Pycsar system effector family protein, partial [Bacteroidota bacterium]
HSINHVKDVVKATKKIGEVSELSSDELEIVQISAWFHDIGYNNSFEKHEEKSVESAHNFLSSINYPQEKINKVTSAIMATKIPQSPKNSIEEVLCDADLCHLGTIDFFDKSELFRIELERRLGKTFSDYEWLQNTIDFFSQQKFFTEYVKRKYQQQRNENLLKLQKKLRKKLKKKESEDIKGERIQIEKEKLQGKKDFDKKADRGIETMFRNVMRTHVEFSSMADSKANIMISVNTLLLGAIATILARKLDTNPHLVIPTLVLSIVSLTTLIFGILVTRPTVTSGRFNKEDIEKKRANLLFFGNFHSMNLKDFTWGMKELMNNKDYLYGSMIKDFYYLGQVLGKKYKYLRICYSIFMYGFILSIIVFAIFIALNPDTPTNLDNILE